MNRTLLLAALLGLSLGVASASEPKASAPKGAAKEESRPAGGAKADAPAGQGDKGKGDKGDKGKSDKGGKAEARKGKIGDPCKVDEDCDQSSRPLTCRTSEGGAGRCAGVIVHPVT